LYITPIELKFAGPATCSRYRYVAQSFDSTSNECTTSGFVASPAASPPPHSELLLSVPQYVSPLICHVTPEPVVPVRGIAVGAAHVLFVGGTGVPVHTPPWHVSVVHAYASYTHAVPFALFVHAVCDVADTHAWHTLIGLFVPFV
jgi:hypothetical protein